MTADAMFKVCSTLALCGWLSLLVSPWWPRITDRIAGLAIPLLLAMVYAGLIVTYWGRTDGGFDSLDAVIRLFGQREIVLAAGSTIWRSI